MNTPVHDHHLALIHRYLDAHVQGDPTILDEVVWPDYYQFNGSTRQDLEAVKRIVSQFGGTTFSVSYTIDDVVLSGDNAFSRVTFDRTHVPSGHKSTFMSLMWGVARDGKLSHGWGLNDTISMWQQEGILPTGPAFGEWLRERRALAAGADTTTEDANA